MAITITSAQLAAALRVGDSAEETAEVSRILTFASTAVQKFAPVAPDAVHNEAVVRLSGYLFDAPTAARRGCVRERAHQFGRGRGAASVSGSPGGPGLEAPGGV